MANPPPLELFLGMFTTPPLWQVLPFFANETKAIQNILGAVSPKALIAIKYFFPGFKPFHSKAHV